MTVTHLGSLTVGQAAPGGLALAAAGTAGIGLALPDLQARLTALASFAPSPPSITTDIALAQQIIASLQLALTVGIQPPSMDVQIAMVAALIATLSATIVSIDAQLSIIANLTNVLNTAGVHAYTFNGLANQLGPQMATELSGGFPGGSATDATNAVVLATTVAPAWAAMSAFFKTTP
jgi:hypothetical protein